MGGSTGAGEDIFIPCRPEHAVLNDMMVHAVTTSIFFDCLDLNFLLHRLLPGNHVPHQIFTRKLSGRYILSPGFTPNAS